METKKLPSGAEVQISMASFSEGHALLKAVTREIESVKIDMKDIDCIKNFLARMVYSDGVAIALRPCLDRCLYNGHGVLKHKINDELFEDEKRRQDYLPLIREVMQYNLTPFFSGLSSSFKDIVKVASGLEQK